jgi:anthranilate phosphoribosyltransferase
VTSPDSDPNFKSLIGLVADGASLSADQSSEAFDIMMSGAATPAQTAAFLMALRVRGETVNEITGAARTMRAKALSIDAPTGAVDTCGTGGDNLGTLNISTAAAIVAAGCGVPVAKHGNRAMSSKSGSADVLEALGVNLDAPVNVVRECLWQAGLCFMMAPRHHGAMKHVGPVRVEMGVRTIFNLLGPLSNPAGTRFQVIGVYDRKWVAPLAEVCRDLGAERVWIVHGADGLDELTTTTSTYVAELKDGEVNSFEISPEDAGLPRATIADLKGGDAVTNADAITRLLAGEASAYRDIVVLNAGAALVVAGLASNLKEAVQSATQAIDQGKARSTLDNLIDISNGPGNG